MAASGDLGALYYEIEARIDKAKAKVDELEKYNLAAIERVNKAWGSSNRGPSGGGSSSPSNSSSANMSYGGGTGWTMPGMDSAKRAAESASNTVARAYESAGRAQANAIRDTSNRTVSEIRTGSMHPALAKNDALRAIASSNQQMAQRVAQQLGVPVEELFNYGASAQRRSIEIQQDHMRGVLQFDREVASRRDANQATHDDLMSEHNGPRLTPLQLADIQHEANTAYNNRPLTEGELRGENNARLGRNTAPTAAERSQMRAIRAFTLFAAADVTAGGINSIMDYRSAERLASSLPTSQQQQLAQAQAQQRAYQANPMNGLGNAIRGILGLETDQDREVAITEAQRAEERRVAARDFNFGRTSLNRSTRFGVASANSTEDVVKQRQLAIQQQYEEATSSQSLNKIMETATQAGLNPQDAINEAKANAAKIRDANNNALNRQIYYANRDNMNSAAVSGAIEQQKYREAKILELRNKHIQELTTTPVSEVATKQQEQSKQMDALNAELEREGKIIRAGADVEAKSYELRSQFRNKQAQREELEFQFQSDYARADQKDKASILDRNDRSLKAFDALWGKEDQLGMEEGKSSYMQLRHQAAGENYAAKRSAIENNARLRIEREVPQAKPENQQELRDLIESTKNQQLEVLNRDKRIETEDIQFKTKSLERQNRIWDATSYPDRAMKERSAGIRDRLDQYRMQIERNPEMKGALEEQRNEFIRGQVLSLTRSAPEGKVMNPLSVIGAPTGGAERQGLIQDLAKAYTGDNKEIIRLLTKIAEKGGGQAVRRSTP